MLLVRELTDEVTSWHAPLPSKWRGGKTFRKASAVEGEKTLISEGDCVMGGYFFEGSKIISGENKKNVYFKITV